MVAIHISRTVAEWMRDLAVRIFQDAYATNWEPNNAENAVYQHGVGMVARMPMEDGPMMTWISATLSLIRCLAAILDDQLTNEIDDSGDIESLSITFGDQAEI